jgi:hypothetical protein
MERYFDKTFKDAALSYVEHGGEARFLPKINSEIGDRLLGEIIPFDIKQLALKLFPDGSNSTRNRVVITPVSAF